MTFSDLQITWQTLLALAGGLIVLIDVCKKLKSISQPFTSIKKMLANDKARLDNHDKALSKMADYQEKSSAVIGLAVAELLNHMITGNDIDKLKRREDELNEFFFRGEHIETK